MEVAMSLSSQEIQPNPSIWRINVRTQALSVEPVPEAWLHLGGRGLVARILLDEVPAICEPLGPLNKLVFTPGLLVGHMLSSCDRISIGGKSPLTRGVKEANAGGTTGLQMAFMGIRALIIEGQPEGKGFSVLYLSLEAGIPKIRFDDAKDLVGRGVYETAKLMFARYGEKKAFAIIGPGGEMRLATAGILHLDKDKTPARIAARGGLGTVMACKGLKAIVFDAANGQKPAIAHPDLYKDAQKAFTKALMAHPQTIIYRDYGTAAMPSMAQGFGGLPTRNFSSGSFEGMETISGEYMRQLLLNRGGESQTSHACMPGCTIRCSNVYGDENGKEIVSPLEYETIGLMGPNLGIDSLDAIARMSW
jgi:aldehyde:ferredoxin oxidoreductase